MVRLVPTDSITPMFILQLIQNPVEAVIYLVALVLGITVHEWAHAWTAYRFGDDTPYLQGRVTLNPVAHLDPIGSILFLVLGFGYGRPVIYNPLRIQHRYQELLIALAGPISNIIFAIIALILVGIFGTNGIIDPEILRLIAGVNVLLAAFNMLPIPPLDGSSIISYFWPEYRSLLGGQIGLFIVLALIFTGTLGLLMAPLASGFSFLASLGGILPAPLFGL
jgi:Zn-dependent protease